MIPLLDLTRQYQALQPELEAAVLDLLESCRYILGPVVADFEAAAAHALGVRHAVGVANGTDALQISWQVLGLQPGDEVITTPFSFFATAEVVSALGATPVFVDIEPDTFNIDPVLIEAAVTPRTRAIIPVHLFGHPAAMTEINALAHRHGLAVLEDAAQAWGAAMQVEDSMQACGALGHIASFSFYPTKNLGACGDAGLITTNDDALAEKARLLRAHGQRGSYVHYEIGSNSRLDALQAAILKVKLAHVTRWNDARRAHAARYNELLAGLPIITPVERPGAHHIYHQYTMRVPQENPSRERIGESLTQAGVGWAVYYPVCLHLQPVYENLGYRAGQLPVAERAAREVLSLPIFPELRPDEVTAAAAAVRAACA
ncbi:MAG TPA: DegT/DnrJ/EryC1/StrS family aminotransferase [Abditibacteriaceae bacterium]|nr:DegT/DnrJ/EryC1/StrS family aminotransferase [Abditibacteriaceae bacterium]